MDAVPLPPQISVTEEPPAAADPGYRDAPPGERGRLVIIRRWYSPVAFIMVIFCLFWNGFLYNWYATATHGPLFFSVVAMVFPLLHVGAGVVVTYTTIAMFCNRTTITVTDQELAIRHAPLPWPGNRRIAAQALRQLYCEEQVSRGKDGTTKSYHLSAVLEGGDKQRLISTLLTAEQVRFIEQKIEERLGIVDAPVAGEYKG